MKNRNLLTTINHKKDLDKNEQRDGILHEMWLHKGSNVNIPRYIHWKMVSIVFGIPARDTSRFFFTSVARVRRARIAVAPDANTITSL